MCAGAFTSAKGEPMKYGDRLQQLREKVGMTQEQLAERSGVKLWTLRGYEQGRREPSWKAALSLAAALGVAAEAFADCEEGTADGADEHDKRPRGRPRKAPTAAQETSSAGKVTPAPSGEKKPARGKRK